jgi:hypothetical protein
MAGAGSRGTADDVGAQEGGAPAAGSASVRADKAWVGTGEASEAGGNASGKGSAANTLAPWNNVRAASAHGAPAATRVLESRT